MCTLASGNEIKWHIYIFTYRLRAPENSHFFITGHCEEVVPVSLSMQSVLLLHSQNWKSAIESSVFFLTNFCCSGILIFYSVIGMLNQISIFSYPNLKFTRLSIFHLVHNGYPFVSSIEVAGAENVCTGCFLLSLTVDLHIFVPIAGFFQALSYFTMNSVKVCNHIMSRYWKLIGILKLELPGIDTIL